MVWHDEAIQIHVHPPTDTQVREYVASRGRHPSGAHAQIPAGEAVSHSFPSEPEGSQQQFHLALRDLDDAPLRQVMEELQQERARREGTTPSLGSPLGQWWGPVGGLDVDLDDGEVTLLQGVGDGDLTSWHSGLQALLKQRRMLVTSSVHLWLTKVRYLKNKHI